MKYIVALIVALVLNASANLLIKAGMKAVHEAGGILRDGLVAGVRTVLTSSTLVLGLTCFGMNAVFYMYALQSKALKISVAYPIMVGGGFALIAVVAHVHPTFAETLTWVQKVGIALVFIGIILISFQAGPGSMCSD